jgi:hypothetical protein
MVWDNNSYQGIDVSKSFGLLILSFLLYFIYRQFLYNKLITRLHDTKYRKRHNYRTYLKDKFPRLSHQEIIDLFCALRDEHFSTRYSRMEVQASAIHFFYLTGFLATAFMLYACIDSGSNNQIIFYGIFSCLGFLLGSSTDYSYENKEYSYISSLSHSALKSSYDNIVGQRRS